MKTKNIRLISCGAAIGMLAACATLPVFAGDSNNGAVQQPAVSSSSTQSCSKSCSSALSFQDLPPAVQSTVRGQIGNQQIREIKQEMKKGENAYKIELLQRSGLFHPTLIVAANGTLLKEYHMTKINEAAGASLPNQ